MSAERRFFAETIRQIRALMPDCRVEVLIPDFQGLEEPLRIVLDAKPNVLNHQHRNRSASLSSSALGSPLPAHARSAGQCQAMGPRNRNQERRDGWNWRRDWRADRSFRDLGACGVDILTIGQYLRPSKDHLPMTRYYTPGEFVSLKEEALKFGFKHVESGPMVRSSYHAHGTVVGR